MTTIVLLGTLDTKGAEYGYLRERVRALGAQATLIDVGTEACRQFGPTSVPPRLPRRPESGWRT